MIKKNPGNSIKQKNVKNQTSSFTCEKKKVSGNSESKVNHQKTKYQENPEKQIDYKKGSIKKSSITIRI